MKFATASFRTVPCCGPRALHQSCFNPDTIRDNFSLLAQVGTSGIIFYGGGDASADSESSKGSIGKTIQRLKHWSSHLSQEVRIQRTPGSSGPKRSKYADDPHPETITLKWVDVDNLIGDLRKSAAELQELTK